MAEDEVATAAATAQPRAGAAVSLRPVAVYLASFAALGLSFGLLGPSLSSFQEQTGSSLGAVGVLFTAQSLGYLVGSLVGGRLYDLGHGHRVLGGALLLIAFSLALVPYPSQLWVLCVLFGLIGVGTGAADVGGNTLLIWRRGGSDAASLNSLHLCFGIGAVATPVIVAWSLSSHDNLVAASLALAVPTAAVGFWALMRPSPDRLPDEHHASGGAASPRTLLVVAVFFLLYVGLEIGFGGWIHSYAQAIDLGTDRTAAAITTAFWGAFLLGRLFAVGIVTRLGPSRLLVATGGAAILGVALVAVSGGAAAPVWIGTIVFGLAIAPLYPTMLAFAGSAFPLSGSATSWFVAASAIGALSLPFLIGVLFDHLGPAAMPATVLVATVLCIGWILVIHAVLAVPVPRARPIGRAGGTDSAFTAVPGSPRSTSGS